MTHVVKMAPPKHDRIQVVTKAKLRKFDNKAIHAAGIDTPGERPAWADLQAAMNDGRLQPYEEVDIPENILTFSGASALWNFLIGNPAVLNAFDNANAHIGVGNSTQAEARTDTDLVGASTDRQPMETGYPSHTDGTADGNDEIQFQAVWGSTEGNFAWEEWAVFNAASGGRILNRRVVSLGTKSSGSTWTLTVTITLQG